MSTATRVAAIATLLAIAFFLPSAAAQQAAGTFTVSDTRFPAGGAAAVEPLALLDNATSGETLFSGHAAVATVCLYEKARTVAQTPLKDTPVEEIATQSSDTTEDCSQFTNPTFRLISGGEHAGWFGIHPKNDTRVSVTPSKPYNVESRVASTLTNRDGNTASASSEEGPAWDAYIARISGDHLATAVEGAIEVSGDGALKLLGMDLEVSGDEGTLEYRTGTFDESGPVHTRTYRWLYVDFESATLVLESTGPVTIAAKTMDSEINGEIRFVATEGRLACSGASYQPRPRQLETLRGVFSASLHPISNAATLTVEGQLVATSLQRSAVPTSPLQAVGLLRQP